jgi:hypothetical protein
MFFPRKKKAVSPSLNFSHAIICFQNFSNATRIKKQTNIMLFKIDNRGDIL